MLTKEQLAAELDGREYPLTLGRDEKAGAKAAGLVIVYGDSDDLMELDGAIYDEVGAGNGSTVQIDVIGIVPPRDQFNFEDETDDGIFHYLCRRKTAKTITAIWDRDGYSWQYETDIPHATFDILEDGEKYCRGIVFALADLSPTAKLFGDWLKETA